MINSQFRAGLSNSRQLRILPLLKDWPSIWGQMNGLERRVILALVYGGLYFGQAGVLQQTEIYPPFDQIIVR
jgi:hypothetical protein